MDGFGKRVIPRKIQIPPVREGNQEARVGDACHASNPFLRLSWAEPSTLPAKSRNG